jgi:hypothetical protein
VRVVRARRSHSSSSISLLKVIVISFPDWVQQTVLARIDAEASLKVTATCCFANSIFDVLCESTIIMREKTLSEVGLSECIIDLESANDEMNIMFREQTISQGCRKLISGSRHFVCFDYE